MEYVVGFKNKTYFVTEEQHNAIKKLWNRDYYTKRRLPRTAEINAYLDKIHKEACVILNIKEEN